MFYEANKIVEDFLVLFDQKSYWLMGILLDDYDDLGGTSSCIVVHCANARNGLKIR